MNWIEWTNPPKAKNGKVQFNKVASEKLHVSVSAVADWKEKGEIPEPMQLLILCLMRECGYPDTPGGALPSPAINAVAIPTDLLGERTQEFSDAVRESGKDALAWLRQAVLNELDRRKSTNLMGDDIPEG